MTANRPAAPDERLDLAAPARSWLLPLIGSACAVGLLVWLYADLDRFGAALRGAEPRWLVVLCAAVLLEQLLSGWKWRQILLDLKPIASLRLCGAILAGYAASILLPLGISPLVRSWLVTRREGLPLASAATERFVDVLLFALLVGLVALTGPILLLADGARGLLAAAGALFLMVFAGRALVLARALRVPGGFVIGAALALAMLGLPDAQAVAMIVLHHAVSIALVVGIGMAVLWQSGISLSLARRVGRRPRGAA